MADASFKKGDIIIGYGRAYLITKVADKENLEGETEPHLFYKPFFKNRRTKTLEATMPVSSFDKTNKRLIISKTKAKEILAELHEVTTEVDFAAANKADSILRDNDPHEVAALIRELWFEKVDPDTNFSYSKKVIYEKAMRQLRQEIAIVYDIEPEKAEEKIESYLKKNPVPTPKK